MLHLGHNLRHKLDRTGTCSDHRHPLAGQVIGVIPARRVEGFAGKALQARNARIGRLIQLTTSADQRLRQVVLTILADHSPQAAGLLELGTRHLRVAADFAGQLVLVHTVLDIRHDLRLRGELATPVGLRLERIRIQMGWHIAGCTRIVIVAPGAAHRGRFFQHEKIVDTAFLQLDSQADTGKTGTDNQHAQRRRSWGISCHCSSRRF